MGVERKIAWAGLLGGPAWGILMWGAAGLGFVPPDLAYYAAVIGGGAGVLVAGALWFHIGWVWLRDRGLQLGPAVAITVSIIALGASCAWGLATWLPAPATNAQLSQYSDAQLRVAAISYAAKMRAFETAADNSRPPMPPYNADMSKEEAARQLSAYTQRTIQNSNNKALEFGNTYRPQAQELREEIERRLRARGVLPPFVELTTFQSFGPKVLAGDVGLAGPTPIKLGADYLERIARLLPQS